MLGIIFVCPLSGDMRLALMLGTYNHAFVDVALRAASILKNSDFIFLFNFLHVAKLIYLLGFEPREYARSVNFEKCCRMH